MKKMFVKLLGWILGLAALFGAGWYAGYMWSYEVINVYGM